MPADRSQVWDGVHVCRPAERQPGEPWAVVMSPDGDAFVDCVECAERWPERVVLIGGPCFGWATRPRTARCSRREAK